ncbi:hypothetical protein [Siphonobacter sp. SORGH_AS_0500]|uniref:hypothetical protein n=1 Tax=Siphonobacter sp. SORGH_AS_0500 TaxID=1864824 RepID=UPI0028632688|nr:hypothetical protein [Siphonobacter sp. SORGH_AS_0500]MDR6197304.1 hypothetical protein [Siphonobacter sp. SORGH_AS_0500]
MKAFILLILIVGFCYLPLFTTAQTGKTQDDQGKPIASAIVMVYRVTPKDTIFLQYTRSNMEGVFSLMLENSINRNFLLRVRAMGYASVQLSGAEWVAPYLISMKPQATELGEVKIAQTRPPIHVKGDTLEFDAKAFANGTERTVEDLLKRLPGLRMNSEGKLFYNNRLIKKIFLDGQELFSQNYTLLTKNLSADLIDKIQAISNYTENPLLRGIEQSDEPVLNLEVKAHRKTKLMGNATAELGTLERGSLNGSLFSLKGPTKLGLIGSANNVGRELLVPTARWYNEDDAFQSLTPLLTPQMNQGVGLGITTPFNVARKRFLFNKGALLGTDVNVKLSKQLKLKLEGSGWQDQQWAESVMRNVNLLPNSQVEYRDSTWQFEKPREINGRLRLDYTPGARHSIRWLSDVSSQDNPQRNFIHSFNRTLSERLHLQSSIRTQQQAHQVEWVHKLNNRNALVASSQYRFRSQPLQATFGSRRYASFNRSDSTGIPLLLHRINYRSQQWQSSVIWKGSRGKNIINKPSIYWKAGIETHLQQDTFDSRFSLNEHPLADSSWSNRGDYRQWLIVPLVEFKHQREHWHFDLKGRWPYYSITFREHVRNTYIQSDRLQPTGQVHLSYHTTASHQYLSLLLARELRLPPVESLWDGYLLSSYRSLTKGLLAFRPVETSRAELGFHHNSSKSYLRASGKISYQLQSGGTLHGYTINDLFSVNTLIPFKGSRYDWHFTTSIDKYFAEADFKLQLTSNLMLSQLPTVINQSEVQLLPFQSMGYKANFISAFDGPVNIELSLDHQQMRSKSISEETQKSTLLQPRMLITGKIGKKWSMQVWGEGLFWKSGVTNTSFYLADASVRYQPSNTKCELELVAQNLLDTRYYFTNFLSPLSFTEFSYRLQPRYLALRTTYRF